MFHIPGVTPEAPDESTALGGRRAKVEMEYREAERRAAYDALNGKNTNEAIDFVMLGCPHNSAEQMFQIAERLAGKKISANTQVWVHTPRQIRSMCDDSGITAAIEASGALVVADSCPAINRKMPAGTATIATDSCKQAHYLPAITGKQTWFGSLDHCIDAALTGRWAGSLT